MGELNTFIIELFKTEQKEKDDAMLWEFYLHRVFDETWDEFKNKIENQVNALDTSESQAKQVIRDNQSVFDAFNKESTKGG